MSVENCQITNTLNDCVYADGGDVSINSSTLAQFYPFDAKRGYAIRFSAVKNPLVRLQCLNSIITGYADDVLQNVFVKAWSNMDNFQNRSKISTWLYRIAVNESLYFIRRKKDIASLGDEANVAVANRLMSDDYFDGDRAQALLQAAIASLPDVQRVVFNLRYYDEMKYSDISRLLNTSEGALKASYHIAVKKITAFVKSHE